MAHHAAASIFDDNNRGEIAGEVTNTRWRNPHVAFEVTVTSGNGQQEKWSVESNSLNALERIGISPDTISVGDQIRAWGAMGRDGRLLVRAYNILLADGEEVVMMPHVSTERRWQDHALVAAIPLLETKDVTESIRRANGIFRVWTQGEFTIVNPALPLTAEAVTAKAAFDPLTDDPVLRCIPTGMPAVMDVTFPIEFTEQGDDIVLRLEQWDTVRVIHMDGDASGAAARPPTRVGYSVGRWEDDALVVETSNIDTMFFDGDGTPLSSAVRVVERFTLSDDENNLHWRAATTDPATFTEPVVLEQTFTWVPGEEIRPYECATDG